MSPCSLLNMTLFFSSRVGSALTIGEHWRGLQHHAKLEAQDSYTYSKLDACLFRLAPQDYHRFHSPCERHSAQL